MTNEQAYANARRLTDWNHHQEAVLTIAKHFKLGTIAKAVEGIMLVHEARGHMDRPMVEMMHLLRDELYRAVEGAHGPETRQAVYDCF